LILLESEGIYLPIVQGRDIKLHIKPHFQQPSE